MPPGWLEVVPGAEGCSNEDAYRRGLRTTRTRNTTRNYPYPKRYPKLEVVPGAEVGSSERLEYPKHYPKQYPKQYPPFPYPKDYPKLEVVPGAEVVLADPAFGSRWCVAT